VAVPGARGCWRTVLLSAAFAAPGCVSVMTEQVETLPEAMPVVVPFGGSQGPTTSDDNSLVEFYRGLLERMGTAYRERDLGELRKLLAGYRRDDTPEWARTRMDGFVALAEGLAFELHCRDHGSLVVVDPKTPLGERLQLRVHLDAPAGPGWTLGSERDQHPVSFGVWLWTDDEFADGGTSQRDRNTCVRLSEPLVLRAGAPLDLPLSLDLDFGAAVRRRIRIVVALLPGYVTAGDLQATVRRTQFGRIDLVQYPSGYEPIRDHPLDTLKKAMARGNPEHFPHVWLAAHFAKEADRDVMLELLIGWVRLGNPGQQRVAMAALKAVTGASYAVGDRDAWLAWWQGRR
jgi:hypothetical protein